MSAATADQIRAEFDAARQVVRESWSEAAVLAALSRAEAVALEAVGEVLCQPLPPDHIRVLKNERWG